MWFAYLIYSPTLEHLEHVWEQCKKLESKFINLEFHQQYYEATKIRLIRDNNIILSPKLLGFDYNIREFSKLYKKKFM